MSLKRTGAPDLEREGSLSLNLPSALNYLQPFTSPAGLLRKSRPPLGRRCANCKVLYQLVSSIIYTSFPFCSPVIGLLELL